MRPANAMKLARVRTGLTQTEAAKRINVRQWTIVQWEKGANTPTKKNALKMAEVYGVSVDELLQDGEEVKK